MILLGDIKALQMGITKIEANRNTILKDKIIEFIKNANAVKEDIEKIIQIEDEESAFDSIGEKDFGKLTFDDFE